MKTYFKSKKKKKKKLKVYFSKEEASRYLNCIYYNQNLADLRKC